MESNKILLWSQLVGLTVEFEVDGRTYQITGRQGMAGLWERLFHAESHPTRRSVGEAEMNSAIARAEVFSVYALYKNESETLTPLALEEKIKNLFQKEVAR